jgi:NADPH2:quinone reductase
MKAIRVQQFGEPEVLQLVEVADLAPGPGQVLVRIEAAGVNPVETYIRSGKYARLPDLPYTPGPDGAGTVAAVGAGVADWKIGDRVYTAGSLTGTYAERALCEAAQLHPLPAGTSFAQGAALGVPYVTAHIALFHRGQARSGETLLIHGGTGGVGLAAVQIAHAAGLRVLATGGTDAGRELVKREGADVVFDHHAPDYTQHILETTGGRGVDVILELLANVNLGKDLPLLAPFGRVAVVGSRGPVEINPRDLMARNADIRGVIGFGLPTEVMRETHRALVTGLEKGELRPVIAREIPLADAAEAHRAVMASGAMGKIVLVS